MARLRKKQLYSLTASDFAAPDYIDHDGRLITRPAGMLPLVVWPNGRWCAPANTFMRELFDRGLSRRNRGGSIAIAASNISHLLRYCWLTRIDLLELTDNGFRAFVGSLLNEVGERSSGRKLRDESTVIAIGRSCLQFLDSVGRQAGDATFIGPNGRIRAAMREFDLRRSSTIPGRNRKRAVRHWHHAAFPSGSARRKRSPVSHANISLLRAQVGKDSKTPHQRMRRHVTIKLLEVTGARRGEVALITVDSVRNASRMAKPMLRVPTLKKRSASSIDRLLPIAKADVDFLINYIEYYRSGVIRANSSTMPDHGILLVSDTTGRPFQAASITKEMRTLVKAAGIEVKACPHMFRHRFLTKLIVALIEQHQLENPDQFRQMLIDSEALKRKALEWSGQSSTVSLDEYIDLAFEEIGNFSKVYDSVLLSIAIDSFKGTLIAEAQALTKGESASVVASRLLREIGGLEDELARARLSREENGGWR